MRRWFRAVTCLALVLTACAPASAADSDRLFLPVLGQRAEILSPGPLDPAFGTNGVVTYQLSTFANPSTVIQPDGKVVLVGQVVGQADGSEDFVLLRYRTDGTLDPTFGTDGRVTTDVSSAEQLNTVVVQPDGKIIAAGWGSVTDGGDVALVRYLPDGSLDPSFGAGGKVITNFGGWDWAEAMAVQPDGRIVVVGTARTYSPGNSLIRYLPDGTLDVDFGNGGTVTGESVMDAIVIQTDGKIVTGGRTSSSPEDFTVERYLPDGTLDPSFGGTGRVTLDLGSDSEQVATLLLQPDGKIIAAGYGSTMTLVRFMPDGTLDATFGPGGVRTPSAPVTPSASAVVLQPDDKLIIGGGSCEPQSYYSRYPDNRVCPGFALARYLPDGSLDPSFGNDGQVVGGVPEYGASVQANASTAALLPDGKLLAAGHVCPVPEDEENSCYRALARYILD